MSELHEDFGIGEDLPWSHVIAEMPTETSVNYSFFYNIYANSPTIRDAHP